MTTALPVTGGPMLLSGADFELIARLVHTRAGIALGDDKAYLVESRLERVARERKLRDLSALAAGLRADPAGELSHAVVEAMTTNETLFFRDTRPFEHLRQTALPALHAARPPGQGLRIWSAASSSGQEAYSIAITVLEADLRQRAVQILASDISPAQVARGRLGEYSEFEVRRGLPAGHLGKYFCRHGDSWRIAEPVRRMVEFRPWNLLDDPRGLGKFDLVFCRNVLIYFDLPTKRKVLQSIWESMVPGGFLYLGGAEATFGVSDRFQPCPGTHHVYTAVTG